MHSAPPAPPPPQLPLTGAFVYASTVYPPRYDNSAGRNIPHPNYVPEGTHIHALQGDNHRGNHRHTVILCRDHPHCLIEVPSTCGGHSHSRDHSTEAPASRRVRSHSSLNRSTEGPASRRVPSHSSLNRPAEASARHARSGSSLNHSAEARSSRRIRSNSSLNHSIDVPSIHRAPSNASLRRSAEVSSARRIRSNSSLNHSIQGPSSPRIHPDCSPCLSATTTTRPVPTDLSISPDQSIESPIGSPQVHASSNSYQSTGTSSTSPHRPPSTDSNFSSRTLIAGSPKTYSSSNSNRRPQIIDLGDTARKESRHIVSRAKDTPYLGWETGDSPDLGWENDFFLLPRRKRPQKRESYPQRARRLNHEIERQFRREVRRERIQRRVNRKERAGVKGEDSSSLNLGRSLSAVNEELEPPEPSFVQESSHTSAPPTPLEPSDPIVPDQPSSEDTMRPPSKRASRLSLKVRLLHPYNAPDHYNVQHNMCTQLTVNRLRDPRSPKSTIPMKPRSYRTCFT